MCVFVVCESWCEGLSTLYVAEIMHITSFFLRPYFVISGMGSGGLSTQLSQQVKTVNSHVIPLQGVN